VQASKAHSLKRASKNFTQRMKAHSLKRASKNFTQRMRKMPEQAVLLQTHLIRYAPKAQDT